MTARKRWTVALGAAAAGAGLVLGSHVSATAQPSQALSSQAVQVQQVTLRLASDPGQVANVSGASQEKGARVIQWPLSRTDNERWEPEAVSGGYYRFRAVHSGKCLNVKGGGNESDTDIIQYTCGNAANEQWKFVPRGIGYQIVARSSNKCLNVRGGVGKGNPLIQYTCTANGAPNDVWLPVWETVTG
ncbi:RICIN domain-containing protein [Streptomyces sp. MMS24-I2-30]|uniref:RICIN domain-containing protein n=1 Tax=Streptomyces sp. MMS24-I2-30 TaxID=3351564 RepID=UPI003896D2E2